MTDSQPGSPDVPLPSIYVSYGLVKSGSTFAFELTKELLMQHSLVQPRLTDSAVTPGHKINFSTNWNREHVSAIRLEAEADNTTIVVKTHARPKPAIQTELEAGRAVGHAIYRDPRDIALSLLDAGERARAKSRMAFSDVLTLDDAMRDIDAHLENFLGWTSLTGIEPIDYASLTTDAEAFAGLLSRQLGLEFDSTPAVAEVIENAFIQLNKGVQERHRAEMSRADSDRFLERYASLYDEYF